MRQNKRKSRIGILGAGGVAKDLHLPALSNMTNVNLSWICDRDEKRARQLAKLFSIPGTFTDIEQCGDVDIVLVAIPVGLRDKVMETIFKRKWHAFCEKPFALTLDKCDKYLAEARKNNLQIGVGLVRRYCPAIIQAKQFIQEQRFGAIEEVWASEGFRTKRTGRDAGFYWFDPNAVGGGILMETGSHLIDQLFTVLNVDNFSLDNCTQHKYKELEFETRLTATVSTSQQQNIKCTVEVSRLNDLCNGLFIKFSNFILKCGLGFDGPLELCTLNGLPFANLNIDHVTESSAFFLEWNDFINQCITGKPSNISADTVRQSISIIEQSYQSAESVDVNFKIVEEKNNG